MTFYNNDLITSKVEKGIQSTEQITQSEISKFINLVSERMRQLEEIYVIDRFEGNYAVCENRNTGEIQNIELSQLPENVKEGNVLRYEKGKYIIDIDIQQKIERNIEEKMNKLWNN